MIMKGKGLSLNATTHYNQWVNINGLNILPSSAGAVALRAKFGLRAAKMTSDLVLVRRVAERANADLSGIGVEKKVAKKTCADLYGLITGDALSFGMEAGLGNLETQMKNATSSKLYNLKDGNFLARCENLDTLLRGVIVDYPLEAIEFFTIEELDAAATSAGVFERKVGVYQAGLADVRSAKREFKTTWFKKMKEHVEFMTNMLSGAITASFPVYAGTFRGLIKLNNVGKRNQGLLPTMVDNVTGLPFAKVASFWPLDYPVTKRRKLGKSNGNGDFGLMRLRVGLWRFKFSVPGYEEQIMILKIDKKEVLKIEVRMVRG